MEPYEFNQQELYRYCSKPKFYIWIVIAFRNIIWRIVRLFHFQQWHMIQTQLRSTNQQTDDRIQKLEKIIDCQKTDILTLANRIQILEKSITMQTYRSNNYQKSED